MPELPEVETIKRVIEPQIQGLVIEKAAVRRPGKFLVIHLENSDRIILHLRNDGLPASYPGRLPGRKAHAYSFQPKRRQGITIL